MSDDTIKDSPSATQDSSEADKSEDRSCCYVVDPCNCYCNPCYMPVSCCC